MIPKVLGYSLYSVWSLSSKDRPHTLMLCLDMEVTREVCYDSEASQDPLCIQANPALTDAHTQNYTEQ